MTKKTKNQNRFNGGIIDFKDSSQDTMKIITFIDSIGRTIIAKADHLDDNTLSCFDPLIFDVSRERVMTIPLVFSAAWDGDLAMEFPRNNIVLINTPLSDKTTNLYLESLKRIKETKIDFGPPEEDNGEDEDSDTDSVKLFN